ncbi:MAG TPA: hypothetical protein VHE13_17315 [Opitutus sp.]|nr:hypothetical protein [Opitutus sp.]HWA85574.1 hypothetical protein [Opitutus sp.]
MRHIFLLGGGCGFLVAGLGGWWAGHTVDHLVLDAAVGCLVGAFLFRWFWTVLIGRIRETILNRPPSAGARPPTGL